MAFVILISSDGLTFSLPAEAAELSTVITEKLVANNGNEVVVENHKGNTVRNVVNFLSQAQLIIGDEVAKEKMNILFLNQEFVNLAELFQTALAAHDLGIQELEDLMCQRITQKTLNKSAKHVRKEFEKYTDLTPEQVAYTKDRYRWAFEAADVAPGEASESAPASPPSESAPASPPSKSAPASPPSEWAWE